MISGVLRARGFGFGLWGFQGEGLGFEVEGPPNSGGEFGFVSQASLHFGFLLFMK